jgi:hypothetical protein
VSLVIFLEPHVDSHVNSIKEKVRSGELTTSGDEWPVFLYHGYSCDPNDPWNGLLRSSLLVKVQ